MTTCPKCKRPVSPSGDPLYDSINGCPRTDGPTCVGTQRTNRAAYRAGVLRGVEIAREHAYVPMRVDVIEWSDVDRAVREEVGDV